MTSETSSAVHANATEHVDKVMPQHAAIAPETDGVR
jgi:hypothetical protein